jgi:hypothetical protein
MNTEEIIINILTFAAGWVLKRPHELAATILKIFKKKK